MRSTFALTIAALLLGTAACKDKGKGSQPGPEPTATHAAPSGDPHHPPLPTDAAPPPSMDWEACKRALVAAAKASPNARAMMVIDGCKPCGDWTPLLAWQTLQADGGPTQPQIDRAMQACKGYCDANGKQRFLGRLDDARQQKARAPWRELGEYCKDQVSAVPDARFMNAPYFALDRIARDVATRAGGQQLLDAIAIPLPAVSVSGVGPALPDAPVSKPEILAGQITVTMADISVGPLPIAKLGAHGITVAGDPFPGKTVALKDLPAALDKLGDKIAVFAPSGMPAARLAQIVKAAGTHTLVLAASARTGPPGWTMHGIVPLALRGTPDKAGVVVVVHASPDEAVKAIKAAAVDALKKAPVTLQLDKDATVASLATVAGALAFLEVPAAALVAPAKP